MYPTGSSTVTGAHTCYVVIFSTDTHTFASLRYGLPVGLRNRKSRMRPAHENSCPYPMNVFHCSRRPKHEWVTRLTVSKPKPVAPLEITTDEEYYAQRIVQGICMVRLQGATGDDIFLVMLSG